MAFKRRSGKKSFKRMKGSYKGKKRKGGKRIPSYGSQRGGIRL